MLLAAIHRMIEHLIKIIFGGVCFWLMIFKMKGPLHYTAPPSRWKWGQAWCLQVSLHSKIRSKWTILQGCALGGLYGPFRGLNMPLGGGMGSLTNRCSTRSCFIVHLNNAMCQGACEVGADRLLGSHVHPSPPWHRPSLRCDRWSACQELALCPSCSQPLPWPPWGYG